MSGIRLAIVGSTQFEDDVEAAARAAKLIAQAICYYDPDVIISGGAPGIDTMAAAFAEENDIELIEHLPKVKRWADGFKPRNLLIAQDCTHLLCIRHNASTTYGSGWTADRAKELGAIVERHVL